MAGVANVVVVHGPVCPASRGVNPGCDTTVTYPVGDDAGPVGLMGVITGRYWFPQPIASATIPAAGIAANPDAKTR
jgi:hypothetical protein